MFKLLGVTQKKLILSAILGLIIQFLGDTAPFVKSIFILVVMDIVLGLICAKWYRLESITTRRFLTKIRELGLFAIGLAAFIVSQDAFVEFGLNKFFGAKFFCSAYIFYELFSILENLGDMGFPIASQIKKALQAKLPKELNNEEQNDQPK